MKYSLSLNSLAQTQHFAEELSKFLQAGDIVCLSGKMGSGKTTLSKSICSCFGINPDIVISPTYTLVNSYEGILPIFHVDLYRLSSPEDMDGLDQEDLICTEGLTLVEWPTLLLPELSEDLTLSIHLEYQDDVMLS